MKPGRAIAPLVLIATLGVATPTDVAFARVAVTADLDRAGSGATLIVRNAGDEPLDCMRFSAAEGVDVTDAIGPGETALRPGGFGSRGFALAPGAAATWEFATADPYPLAARGRLTVGADCDAGTVVAVTGPGPSPVAGRRVVVELRGGIARVRGRGRSRFAVLVGGRLVADGSEVDARGGTVRVTVADRTGATRSAEIFGGRAIVGQRLGRRQAVTVRLSKPLVCGRTRSLRVEGHGRLLVRARYATVSANGPATWRTTDRCGRTVTRVAEGVVRVTVRGGRTVTARAGQRVVALPPRRSG